MTFRGGREPAPDGRAMKILLAMDDSKYSQEALEAVIERFRPDRAEVRVITVLDLLNYFASEEAAKEYLPEIEQLRRERLKQAEQLLRRAADRLKSAGFQVTTGISEGDPKKRILELAESWDADQIVLGSHGRKGFEHALLGSVSEAVVHHARCSVEIVRKRS